MFKAAMVIYTVMLVYFGFKPFPLIIHALGTFCCMFLVKGT